MNRSQSLRNVLQHLARFDLQLVLWYAHRRRLDYWLRLLPFPAKLAILDVALLPLAIILAPPVEELPPAALPMLWLGCYCVAFILAALMPGHRRRARIHLIN